MNELHESNRACWNAWADWWRERAEKRGTWRECHRDPALVLSPDELRILGELARRDACVLGSGDNEVVFALAGMGARVTSVDISERQLEVAKERAGVLDLGITFVRSDVTDLAGLADGSFDVAYTGGHMSVWISDIRKYYAEAARVLRPGGLLLVNDYHPVRRMWHESDGPAPRRGYFDRGPHRYRTNEGLDQIEFHWTVAEHVQAVIDAGCILVEVREHGDGPGNPEYAAHVPPGLPMWLLIAGRKVSTGPLEGIGRREPA